MDCFQTSKAQVVLEIKEGNGFAFLTNPVIVVASLNGIKLETKEILPSNGPQFDSELIWQADTKYLRRLRSINTALKLECFTLINYLKQNSQRARIGYILLNLKEAQIITPNDTVAVLASWHRLLGLKNLSHALNPELLLKFKIEESVKMKSYHDEVNIKEGINEEVYKGTNFGMGDHNLVGMVTSEAQNSLQIGPKHLCTELYEVSINVISIGHIFNIIPKENVDIPIKAHFIMFGYSFFTKDLSVFRENMNNGRISLKIWSQLQFISAYFKEFPMLVLSIYSGDEIVGTTLLDLQALGSLTTKKNVIINDKVKINSTIAVEEKNEFLSEVESPFLEIEFQLRHKKDHFSTKIDQETQSNCDYMPEIYETGDTTNISNLSIRYNESSSSSHRHGAMEPGPLETNTINLNKLKLVDQSSAASKLGPKENSEMFVTLPNSIFPNDVPDLLTKKEQSKISVQGAALRACEELEEWKEKQQEMFKFELKKKSDRHLKKLSNEWLKKKYQLEEDLKKRIEECHNLKEKLTSALEDLTQRSEQLAIKEEEMKTAKEELDKNYTMKFQELRKASKLHEYDMEDKIHEISSEKAELYNKLEDSRKEILRLQDALLNQEMPNQLSKDQTASLISEIRTIEQKLEKAVESKTFFKEQWGKAVRELHKMKEEEQQQLKWQIQKNRHELQTLGLVKEISQEVGEMKKDQSTIKNIRNELANFISPNNDPLVDPFQSTHKFELSYK